MSATDSQILAFPELGFPEDPLDLMVPDNSGHEASGWGDAMTWEEYELLVQRSIASSEGKFDLRHFNYVHPVRLQSHWPEHQRKPTPVRLSYTAWGDPDNPAVILVGGIANTARRWDHLALALSEHFYTVCLDWAGRGMSAWMPTQEDYSVDSHIEQVLQFIRHLDCDRVSIVGSSLGGSTAMALAARHPGLVERLVLNDIGPFMPAERRRRRAQAVARHYVFRRPAELFRRLGASAKNEGPVTEEELLHNTYFQTKWSDANGGRVYRHDPRALQAYAEQAQESLNQWQDWQQLDMQVLVIHGMVSDALLPDTVAEMILRPHTTLMEVPDTGHTPALSDENQIHFLRGWLTGFGPQGHFSCLNPPATARHLFTKGTKN